MASSAALGAKVEAAIPALWRCARITTIRVSDPFKHSAFEARRVRVVSVRPLRRDIPAARASASSSVVSSEPRTFRDNLGPCCSGAPG